MVRPKECRRKEEQSRNRLGGCYHEEIDGNKKWGERIDINP